MTLPDSLDDLLRDGLAALRVGDRGRAMNLLARAVRLEPRSEQAWLYLAGAVADPEQRRTCLERVLSLNPQNGAARQGLQALAPPPVLTTVPLAPPTPQPQPPSAPPARPAPP
ncbi:MAG: hypothetical protein HGA65_15675, partial [Oscillochloris sp.]|nr:hypothetical protein [Oscillochloris sp.]